MIDRRNTKRQENILTKVLIKLHYKETYTAVVMSSKRGSISNLVHTEIKNYNSVTGIIGTWEWFAVWLAMAHAK